MFATRALSSIRRLIVLVLQWATQVLLNDFLLSLVPRV